MAIFRQLRGDTNSAFGFKRQEHQFPNSCRNEHATNHRYLRIVLILADCAKAQRSQALIKEGLDSVFNFEQCARLLGVLTVEAERRSLNPRPRLG